MGKIEANETPIDVGYSAAPVITDWNNDGKKDLVVGSENNGVRVYLNISSNKAPAFGDYLVLDNTEYYQAHPEVYDLNRDGKKDLIISENEGYLYFYENTGSDSEPVFFTPRRMKTRYNDEIKLYARARVEVNDWNGDGYPDLLVGDEDGYITTFINSKTVTGIENPQNVIPANIELYQNFPNPFNPATEISFALNQGGMVQLRIYNLAGELIKTLVKGNLSAGEHKFYWDAKNRNGLPQPGGVYFYTLTSAGQKQVRKMVYLK